MINYDILMAVSGDINKYNLILKRTRQADIVRLRWEVFLILRQKKYTSTQIAKAFGITHASVLHGLKQFGPDRPRGCISEKMINEIGSDDRRVVFKELKKKGFTFLDIAFYFKTTPGKVNYQIRKLNEEREFEEFEDRRKLIKKFK